MKDWSKIKYFKREEFDDAELVCDQVVELVDLFRALIGTPIYITYVTKGKHVARWHGLGLAVDFVVESVAHPHPLDLVHTAMRLPGLKGLGVYPQARHPKCVKPLGFHFDVRPGSTPLALWIAIPSSEPGKIITQVAFNSENLRKFNLV